MTNIHLNKENQSHNMMVTKWPFNLKILNKNVNILHLFKTEDDLIRPSTVPT